MKKTFVISIFILGFVSAFGQTPKTDCGPKDYKPNFETLFGPDRLWAYGLDTLVTISKRQVIYYCESCRLTGSDKKGIIKWTKDLSTYKCSLITFSFFNCKTGGKINGGDIILQFKDKTFYCLNSKTGEIKPLSEDDIEKNKSRGYMGIKMKNN